MILKFLSVSSAHLNWTTQFCNAFYTVHPIDDDGEVEVAVVVVVIKPKETRRHCGVGMIIIITIHVTPTFCIMAKWYGLA